MKKLSTHIKGLDELFHGGIQVTSVTEPQTSDPLADTRKRDSLVVIIRGCRGSNKHLFALQLMHGLGMSIFDHQRMHDKDVSNRDKKGVLRYYSINKPTHLLEDMYLDMLIQRWISHTNIEYKGLVLGDFGTNVSDAESSLNDKTKMIFDIIFRTEEPHENVHNFYKRTFQSKVAQYFAENIIGYNARTNSLHLRNGIVSDDFNNFMFKRRYESIGQYFKEDLNKIQGLSEQSEDDYYCFRSEFLNAEFNPHILSGNKQDDSSNNVTSPVRKAASARANFFSILNHIEEEVDMVNSSDGKKSFPCEVAVIDGFSHISEKDLQSLPYNHLLDCLRNLARISILIFEDSQTTMPDGDIEIEIRENSDDIEEYSYNEIQIAKCVNQITAPGWHLYTRHESQIEIFPSIQLRLFKRNYINNQMHELGRSILDDSYEMFLDNMTFKEKDIKSAIQNLESFLNQQSDRASKLMDHFIKCVEETDKDWTEEKQIKVLKKILKGKWQCDSFEPKTENQRLHNHCPITAIVGNPNSHKRDLAMCRIFAKEEMALKDGHVLILLLDKDPEEMRKKFLCPGMYSKFSSSLDDYKRSACKNKCMECYKRVSFLNVNPGCITPEEFLSMVHDQIQVYVGQYRKNQLPRPLHIVLDDYHRIDFNFPFLGSSNLFTSALISICQSNNVGLTILCDKSSKRVREVCTLSDYVLCVERNEKDVPNKVTVYTERLGDEIHSSSIIKYRLDNVKELMKCDSNGLVMNKELKIKPEVIGSMKEYWRFTANVIQHPNPREGNS